MKVEVAGQVIRFVRKQSPEPRRALRLAVRQLKQERGDIQPLHEHLDGFYRLRVGRYRVIFEYHIGRRGERKVRCVYAATRSVVYEVFAQQLQELITE